MFKSVKKCKFFAFGGGEGIFQYFLWDGNVTSRFQILMNIDNIGKTNIYVDGEVLELWLAELDLKVIEEKNPGQSNQNPGDQQHHYLAVKC